jgi:chemotaxis protein histidine kinase CheA
MSILSKALDESMSLSAVGDYTFEMSVTSCQYVDGAWVCQTATTEKPDEAPESIEKADETPKITEKPDETTKRSEKLDETLKSTEKEKSDETPKITEKPDETPKRNEKLDETSKGTEKQDETANNTEKTDGIPKSTEKRAETRVEKDERSAKPTEKLSMDESKFLSEFFLPIADALRGAEVEAWVVPSQYYPMQVDSGFLVLDEEYPKVQQQGRNKQELVEQSYGKDLNKNADLGYYGLVKKWRRVPCSRMYQDSNPLLLFINDDQAPLVDDGICGIFFSALIIMLVVLFCCMIQKLKKKKYRNQFSTEKRERLLATTDFGENGSYVPPSFKLSVTKSSKKTADDEPRIIFI